MLFSADFNKNEMCYGKKIYTSRLHFTGSKSWLSFIIRALAKLYLLKIKNFLTSSKYEFSGQFSDVVGPHSKNKRDIIYIFSERTFYWLSCPFYKRQNTVLFWRNKPFSNTLLFADFSWCQQKLEVIWQQSIYQETLFYLVYKFTRFHDQSISQTEFMTREVGSILPHPGRIQGPKSPDEIRLIYKNRFWYKLSVHHILHKYFILNVEEAKNKTTK